MDIRHSGRLDVVHDTVDKKIEFEKNIDVVHHDYDPDTGNTTKRQDVPSTTQTNKYMTKYQIRVREQAKEL